MTAQTAQIDRGFDVNEIDENRTRISGKGPGLMGFGIGGVIFLIFVTIFLASSIAFFSVIAGLVVLIGLPLFLHVTRSKSFTFDLTSEGIETGGKLYPRSDISKVFVYNKAAGGEISGNALVYNNSVVQSGSVALTETSAKIGARVLYQVGIMHGRKRIILAKNITEDMAESLFSYLTEE